MIYIHKSNSEAVIKYDQILTANKIAFEFIDSHEAGFWEKIRHADLFISHLEMGSSRLSRQNQLISIIDKTLLVPCFPDWNTAWHYDDKVAGYMLLEAKGYPLVQSWIFWDKLQAIEWLKHADYPLVFKLKHGAGSINVVKVCGYKAATRLVNLMFGKGIINNRVPGSRQLSIYQNDICRYAKSNAKYMLDRSGILHDPLGNWERERGYVFFQRFVPNNRFDIRVNVIGNATFAFRRMNRPHDFRSSGSGEYDLTPGKIPDEAIRMSQQISKEMGFQEMAYDFLIDENSHPVITEIGCQSAGRAIPLCPGYWDWNMKWHKGHYVPQFMHLKYLLHRDDLIQPESVLA